MPLFADSLHDEFASWALGFISGGGADYGEVVAIASAMKEQTDDAFFSAWADAAERHIDAAAAALEAGHRATARGHYLRGACFYGVGYHVLYGAPVDPRLAHGFERQMTAFEKAIALSDTPAEMLSIPFEGHDMMACFLRAAGASEGERRPLVIITNGYDATVVDMYLAVGRATAERGYHCLMFDGPGQGAMLVRDGVVMIPDWERVVTVVVDAVLERPDVDPEKIVLEGWSLGGYLAPRAASGEHRLAACIADPPGWALLAGVPELAKALGMSAEAAAALPEISDADEAMITKFLESSRELRWKIMQRGYWVNGATDLRSYLAAATPFTLEGRADQIRCPVLATKAEHDALAAGAEAFIAALTAPTTLIQFTAAEGAGGHCELENRWLANQRILDWIDDTLQQRPTTASQVERSATGT